MTANRAPPSLWLLMLTPWKRSLTLVLLLAACGGDGHEPRIPSAILLEPAEPRVVAYDSVQVVATVVDTLGDPIPDEPVAFYVARVPMIPVRADVSATGMLRCLGLIGNAYLVATSGPAETITDVSCLYPRSAIWIWPKELTLRVGQESTPLWEVTDEQGVPTGRTVTLTSTDPGIAAIVESFFVKGISIGTTTMVASTPDWTDVVVDIEVVP